jgi:WD40 repeat protein
VGTDKLLTAGNDGLVRLWDCASSQSGTLTKVAEAQHARGIWRLACRDTTAATCAKDGCVVVWHVAEAALHERRRLEVTEEGSVRSVALAEQVVAAAADDGKVTGWDLRSGTQTWSIEAHADGAQSCAFKPGDVSFILTAGADRACKLWDLRSSSKPVRAFDQHHRTDARRRAMHHPAWLSSTTFAVGGEGSERLAFYDATSGALTASLALGADATAVARVDAATVAVATEACDGVSLYAVA